MEAPSKKEILAKVIDFCHEYLIQDKEVYGYLKKVRKLSDETISEFKLGAFPRNIYHVIRDIDPWELQLAGIMWNDQETEMLTPRFLHNRVMIPIYDVHQRPISLIGRSLLTDEKRAELGVHKYTNTKFSKGSCLFGLNAAKDHIRRKNEAIVVEGNFDVITAHQNGLKNVVASSGSWFTPHQFNLLSRYTNNISISFDNDKEGQRAAERILKRNIPNDVIIKQKDIPEPFKDLDEYFKAKAAYVTYNRS